MSRKLFQLEIGEEALIMQHGSGPSILIKNEEGNYKIIKINEGLNENIRVVKLDLEELTNFVLLKLLEENNIKLNRNEKEIFNNQKLINRLLEKEYKSLNGKGYENVETIDEYFLYITQSKK